MCKWVSEVGGSGGVVGRIYLRLIFPLYKRQFFCPPFLLLHKWGHFSPLELLVYGISYFIGIWLLLLLFIVHIVTKDHGTLFCTHLVLKYRPHVFAHTSSELHYSNQLLETVDILFKIGYSWGRWFWGFGGRRGKNLYRNKALAFLLNYKSIHLRVPSQDRVNRSVSTLLPRNPTWIYYY